ncbi:hypothetical protein FRC03_011693 [Tulasnella sp. 419]|nr:hypothetical protein FRC03_011693 [Tulasnella sp. 419]
MHAHNYAQLHRLAWDITDVSSGASHAHVWTATLTMGSGVYIGTGRSKQEARDAAAQQALIAHGVDLSRLR